MDSSFMCAGGIGGVDTCKGDGGSPLVCKTRNGPWYQVKNIYLYIYMYIYIYIISLHQAGIVSWGIGCGEENVPAVYASVATASCWIDKEVAMMMRITHYTRVHCPPRFVTSNNPTLILNDFRAENFLLHIV